MTTTFKAPLGARITRLGLAVALLAAALPTAQAQQDIDRPPINYESAEVSDAIFQLQQKLDAGEASLSWDDKHGWLPSLLELLDVPASSQLLVFSKTSLQFAKINPQRPRALYFNDDVYIGTVQYGDLVEISAVDPHQGAIFYSLEQKKSDSPQFKRDRGQCLSCHHSHRTQDVPGYLVRSVFTAADGNPYLSLGSTTTDQTTDLLERYGGWYVTGIHGSMRHRGNAIAASESAKSLDIEKGANLTDLEKLINTAPYLSPYSDLVALMVMEHQAQMHNFITRACYEARQANHYDKTWNEILDRPADSQSDVSKRRITKAGEAMLRYLLFSGEYQLSSPVKGSSDFAKEFSEIGPRDSKGRSLRDFDLEKRLFKYPCSYLIYSESYDALPKVMRQYVNGRLKEVLSGDDNSADFSHLSTEDRTAIYEILKETKPGIF